MKKIALLVALTAASLTSHAHQPLEHGCVAPVRPHDDQDDALWQRFLDEIDAFRECVSEAKDRHEAAVRAHQTAARDAVETWNSFVRSSLNAPEDFPWPPDGSEKPGS